MLLVALIVLPAGVVLGLRFRALVLVPAMTIVIMVVFAVGIARAQPPWPLVLTLAATIASLQIGYFAGALVRHLLPSPRTSGVRNSSLADARLVRAASGTPPILRDK